MSVKPCSLAAVARQSAPRTLTELATIGTRALMTLALGFTAAGIPTSAQALPAPVSKVAISTPTASYQPLPDGVYLYGQSPKANQIGSAYMVLKVNKRQVVGAFYMPSSSFDCFRGEQQAERLALDVVDSYEQTSQPYSVALKSTATVASTARPGTPTVVPAGFHPIKTISRNDYKILTTCQASR